MHVTFTSLAESSIRLYLDGVVIHAAGRVV